MSGGSSAATIAAVAAVGGAGLSAYGSIQSAQAQKASADYQAQVAAGNQQTALQNAHYASMSGEQQAAIQEQKTRAEVGAELAAQGSSGVDINSPTASAVRTSKGMIGALDAQTIRSNAARQAYGYQTQSTDFANQASADIAKGQNAETAGYIDAGSSLLKGVSAASNYAGALNNASGLKSTDVDPVGQFGG